MYDITLHYKGNRLKIFEVWQGGNTRSHDSGHVILYSTFRSMPQKVINNFTVFLNCGRNYISSKASDE